MSKGNIINLGAIAAIVIFFVAVYFLPPLKQAFLYLFCIPELTFFRTSECISGIFLLYFIQFIALVVLVIRFFTKVVKNI